MITVRYFAAAKAAAGLDEERVDLSDLTPPADDGAAPSAAALTLGALLEALLRLERPGATPDAPELSRVLSRSSFLINGVAAKDHAKPLSPGDTVDVLPPFAGG
ncbi:MoaD/ThiS family protein [Arthrobacter woluwensis]|uniref:MoaD/ThiS family protein n=1 Tax=Arthrobacter woluwensis TaxID=156980 RepID=UPI001FBA2FD5